MRVRWNTNTDTPLPPDEPAGENPPDGAMIDYYIGRGQRRTGDAGDQRREWRSRAALFE